MKNTLKQIAEGRDSIEVVRNLAREALAQPEQKPVAWSYWQSCLNDDGTQTAPWVHRLSKFKPTESIINKDVTPLYTTPPQPEQEPVAIHQFRSPHCADWYDGIPDHHDGHGPYEVRTLYTTPPQPEQEPVATVAEIHMSRYTIEWTNGPLPEGSKLYTTPPQRTWIGLTDEERDDIILNSTSKNKAVAKTEAKLKEKNT